MSDIMVSPALAAILVELLRRKDCLILIDCEGIREGLGLLMERLSKIEEISDITYSSSSSRSDVCNAS